MIVQKKQVFLADVDVKAAAVDLLEQIDRRTRSSLEDFQNANPIEQDRRIRSPARMKCSGGLVVGNASFRDNARADDDVCLPILSIDARTRASGICG